MHHCPLNRCEEWSFDDPNYHSAFMFSIIGLPVRVEFGIVVMLVMPTLRPINPTKVFLVIGAAGSYKVSHDTANRDI